MNGNTELLNYIYQNAQMGQDTTRQIMGLVEDSDFSRHLSNQLDEYRELHDKAKDMLNEAGREEKDIGALDSISAYMGIGLKTLNDRSTSHIADMMVKGSTMGVVEATKLLHEYDDADREIVSLLGKLIRTEQNNIDTIKQFL